MGSRDIFRPRPAISGGPNLPQISTGPLKAAPVPAIFQAEEALLASILATPSLFESLPPLDKSDFSSGNLGEVFAAIRGLVESGSSVDAITVAVRLEAAGCDAKCLLSLGLRGQEPASLKIATTYAEEILSTSRRRKVAAAAMALATDPDSEDLAEQVQRAREHGVSGKGLVTSGEAVDSLLNLIEDRASGLNRACSTGLQELDELLDGGLRAGQMVVIGGRPGEGKSVLAQGIAEANGSGDKVVLHISLEMEASEVLERRCVACSRGVISSRGLRTGKLSNSEQDALEELTPRLRTSTIRYLATESATIERICALASGVAAKEEIGLVILDYLQLAESGLSTEIREQHIAMVSRKLKQLAMILRAPVIALSQLNRKAEPGRRPQLSDLRESGAIEQDADVVIFIHAEEPNSFVRELVVAKNRAGSKGSAMARWLPNQLRFEDMSPALNPAVGSELEQIGAHARGQEDLVLPAMTSQIEKIKEIRRDSMASNAFASFGG